ncbi:MAG TPA: hypothetical protein DDY78_24795 [Planctomycetales bacterium]|nr:hypothetical protein [Planctomycetales bacterium]
MDAEFYGNKVGSFTGRLLNKFIRLVFMNGGAHFWKVIAIESDAHTVDHPFIPSVHAILNR